MKDSLDQQIDDWLKQEVKNRGGGVPKSFHAGFLQMIDSLPERNELVPEKRIQAVSRTRKRLLAAASAAIIVSGIAAGTYVSPTFAEWVKSFFTRPELDKGLQTAAQQGFSQIQQASVTDQGITLRVKEVLTDTKRLIFTYSLEKADGTMLDPTTIFEEVERGPYKKYFIKDGNNFYISDDKGSLVSQSINYQQISGRKVTQGVRDVFRHENFADATFVLKENLTAKQIYLNILLKKVNGIDGTWSLKVPIDLEKSIAATTTIPINASYTTASGLAILLKDVTYSPTVTTFAIQSEWTDEAKLKMRKNHPEFFYDDGRKDFSYHEVHFDVVNETGKVVATTDPQATKAAEGLLIKYDEIDPNHPTEGSLKYVNYSFAPFNTNQNLKLVLRGIQRGEQPQMEWKVNLNDLEKRKEIFNYKNFNAAITGIQYGKENSVLELEEEVMFMGGDFEILDESGSVLPIIKENVEAEWGEPDPETKIQRLKVKLPVKGLTKETKTISLRLNGVATFDRNVNWQVPIPPNK